MVGFADTNQHSGRLAQLARASRLHREGRGFEPLIAHLIVVSSAIQNYKSPCFSIKQGLVLFTASPFTESDRIPQTNPVDSILVTASPDFYRKNK